MARLLPGGTPRSDDDHAPNGRGEPPALHPLTGTFADPKQEEAFGAWAFRTAFTFHVVLFVLMIGLAAGVAGAAGIRGSASAVAFFLFLAAGLGARVVVYYIKDEVDAQRLGAAAWTIVMALSELAYMLAPFECTAISPQAAWEWSSSIFAVGVFVGIINGSHGMGFRHKTALVVLYVAGDATRLAANASSLPADCAEPTIMGLEDLAVLVGAGLAHAAELLLRQAHAKAAKAAKEKAAIQADLEAQNDRLLAQNDRLTWNEQLRAHGAPRPADDRSAVQRGLQAQTAMPQAEQAGCEATSLSSSASQPVDDDRPSSETAPTDENGDGDLGATAAAIPASTGPVSSERVPPAAAGPSSGEAGSSSVHALQSQPLFTMSAEARAAVQAGSETHVQAKEEDEEEDAASNALSHVEGDNALGLAWSSSTSEHASESSADRRRREVAMFRKHQHRYGPARRGFR